MHRIAKQGNKEAVFPSKRELNVTNYIFGFNYNSQLYSIMIIVRKKKNLLRNIALKNCLTFS